MECAPFARALTGVALTGPAADWWAEAQGRYTRSHHPDTGSLLILRRSARLPSGHVAVVSQVVSRRQIMVTQANWVHHRVTEDQTVIDVSSDGDWSAVRVWWPPSGQMGVTEYAAFGFIRPDHPAGHDRLIAAVPAAIRVAEQGW
nr:CHAP domain-containing protein [uncultured Rhodopila sp.]